MGTGRFTGGLVLDVAATLAEHGYGPLDGAELVELHTHLVHFLHGRERGHDRCYGGVR